MSERGFTLLETVFSLAILGIVLLGVLPAFQNMMDTNSFTERRWNASAAAEQVLERLRESSPVALPSSGSSPAEIVTVGDWTYEVVARYCTTPGYCGTQMRHIVLEVSFAGSTVYTLETVYTRLR